MESQVEKLEHFPNIRVQPFLSFPYVSIKTPFLVTSNDAGQECSIFFTSQSMVSIQRCTYVHPLIFVAMVQSTGAQEWHIVSLLGDVRSPTTVAHYVSMTSDLRVLSTEKHLKPRRQHMVYTNKRLECKGKVHSSPLNKQGGFITSEQWMEDRKRFPSVA